MGRKATLLATFLASVAIALMLSRTPSLGLRAYAAEPFSDVDANTSHQEDVLWLVEKGISAGWKEDDGTFTFRPFDDEARCNMAAFLHRLRDKDLVGKPNETAEFLSAASAGLGNRYGLPVPDPELNETAPKQYAA